MSKIKLTTAPYSSCKRSTLLTLESLTFRVRRSWNVRNPRVWGSSLSQPAFSSCLITDHDPRRCALIGPSDSGAVMAEVMPPGSSDFALLTCQSDPLLQMHLNRGAGPEEEGGANQRSAYCKELLMRGETEFSFEELRTERYQQMRKQQLDEKRRRLKMQKGQLNHEVEEKKKLLLLSRSGQVTPEGPTSQIRDSGPAAAFFQIYDESKSAAALPAGEQLQDDVFLRADERGLCLQIQYPRPDHQGGALEDHQVTAETLPPIISQTPKSEAKKKLSPIQEKSLETNSLASQGGCNQLRENLEEMETTLSAGGGAVDPCEPDLRRTLLDLCDVTSSPNFCSESRPLPPVEEQSFLELGGEIFHIISRVQDGGSFSIYIGTKEDTSLFIKVDDAAVPWDFHQFQCLKTISPDSAHNLPLVRCFLFLDGCITVYTTSSRQLLSELTGCSEAFVSCQVVGLLNLVSQLHSCRLLHAALQPHNLACNRGSDWVFPVDWSSSLDLNLQRDITSVKQVPSAQDYVSLGLLEPDDPPQLVDLLGVAETVHFLLTDSRMVAVRNDGGWTAERFSGEEHRMWRRFFTLLLNARGRSSSSVLSELKGLLSTRHH